MITRLSINDLPLQVLNSGYVDINKPELVKLLRRVLMINDEEKLTKIIDRAYSYSGFPLCPEKDNSLKESASYFIRNLKIQARPIVVAERLSETDSLLVNPHQYYTLEDMNVSFGPSVGTPHFNLLSFDITDVLNSLVNHGFILENEIPLIISDLNDSIENNKKLYLAASSVNIHQFNEKVKTVIQEYIDNLIRERWLFKYHSDLLDCHGLPNYIVIDSGNKLSMAEENLERFMDLMYCLGYATNEDEQAKVFTNIMEKLLSRLREEYDKMDDDDELSEQMKLMLINTAFLNALFINALDGKQSDDKLFDYELINKLEYSQSDIELYFLDYTIALLQYEHISELVQKTTEQPHEKIQDDVLEVVQYLKEQMELLSKEKELNPYKIYKSLTNVLQMELKRLEEKYSKRKAKLRPTSKIKKQSNREDKKEKDK